ncbi:MAG: hypothetical protein ACK58N_17040, partial [Synechocystis sp.]
MKRFLLTVLFLAGIWFALSYYLAQHGLAQRGKFESVIINFKDDIPTETLTADIQSINNVLKKPTDFNSIFSINDYIYTVKGDKKALKQLVQKAIALSPNIPSEAAAFIDNVQDVKYLAHLIVPYLS